MSSTAAPSPRGTRGRRSADRADPAGRTAAQGVRATEADGVRVVEVRRVRRFSEPATSFESKGWMRAASELKSRGRSRRRPRSARAPGCHHRRGSARHAVQAPGAAPPRPPRTLMRALPPRSTAFARIRIALLEPLAGRGEGACGVRERRRAAPSPPERSIVPSSSKVRPIVNSTAPPPPPPWAPLWSSQRS